MIASPDGLGMLVGILGFASGTGNISEYSFSGQFLGVFASAGTGGFTEATAMTSVPEPGTFVLAGLGVAMLGLIARRRRAVTRPSPNGNSDHARQRGGKKQFESFMKRCTINLVRTGAVLVTVIGAATIATATQVTYTSLPSRSPIIVPPIKRRPSRPRIRPSRRCPRTDKNI